MILECVNLCVMTYNFRIPGFVLSARRIHATVGIQVHGGTTEEGNCSYLLPLSHREVALVAPAGLLTHWSMAAILANDFFYCIFLNENVRIPIQISLKYVPRSPIDNKPALVQVMAWRRAGAKPLPDPFWHRSMAPVWSNSTLVHVRAWHPITWTPDILP